MKTCLIVDDSRVVRKYSRRSLEALGFSVSEACNGREALDCCEEGMPDLILLDWNMPVMSGMEFLSVLRSEEDGKRPVVVFCLSAWCWESYNAALLLARKGFGNVQWYRGGTRAWIAAGLPAETVAPATW